MTFFPFSVVEYESVFFNFSRLITIFPCLFCVYLHLLRTSQKIAQNVSDMRAKVEHLPSHTWLNRHTNIFQFFSLSSFGCWLSSFHSSIRSVLWHWHWSQTETYSVNTDSHIRWDKFEVFHYNDEIVKRLTYSRWATLLHKMNIPMPNNTQTTSATTAHRTIIFLIAIRLFRLVLKRLMRSIDQHTHTHAHSW